MKRNVLKMANELYTAADFVLFWRVAKPLVSNNIAEIQNRTGLKYHEILHMTRGYGDIAKMQNVQEVMIQWINERVEEVSNLVESQTSVTQ